MQGEEDSGAEDYVPPPAATTAPTTAADEVGNHFLSGYDTNSNNMGASYEDQAKEQQHQHHEQQPHEQFQQQQQQQHQEQQDMPYNYALPMEDKEKVSQLAGGDVVAATAPPSQQHPGGSNLNYNPVDLPQGEEGSQGWKFKSCSHCQ